MKLGISHLSRIHHWTPAPDSPGGPRRSAGHSSAFPGLSSCGGEYPWLSTAPPETGHFTGEYHQIVLTRRAHCPPPVVELSLLPNRLLFGVPTYLAYNAVGQSMIATQVHPAVAAVLVKTVMFFFGIHPSNVCPSSPSLPTSRNVSGESGKWGRCRNDPIEAPLAPSQE